MTFSKLQATLLNPITSLLAVTAIVFLVTTSNALAQRGANGQPTRMVFLEVFAERNAAVGTQQNWMQALQGVGADRIVAKTGRLGRPTVEETKSGNSVLIQVKGSIVRDKLRLPGGTFGIRDKAGIRDLLQKLRDDGATVALADKKAFGLTSEQLVDLHSKFATVVDFETKGQRVGKVIERLLANQPGLRFVADDFARAGLAGDEKVAEEFKGLSLGTVLAAIVRPLGLVIEPKREQGKSMQIHLVDSRTSKEHWPIGWPLERAPVNVEPRLFDRLDIEIRGFPMEAAMNAVQKRSGVPFLYDYNSMAREGIELSEVRVTLVQKKASILVAVSKLLGQTRPRLFEEVRVDENGKAFLWIAPK